MSDVKFIVNKIIEGADVRNVLSCQYNLMEEVADTKLKNVLKNAKITCKRDGYNQVVYRDNSDGSYGFFRENDNVVTPSDDYDILYHVIGNYNKGIFVVTVDKPSKKLIARIKA